MEYVRLTDVCHPLGGFEEQCRDGGGKTGKGRMWREIGSLGRSNANHDATTFTHNQLAGGGLTEEHSIAMGSGAQCHHYFDELELNLRLSLSVGLGSRFIVGLRLRLLTALSFVLKDFAR